MTQKIPQIIKDVGFDFDWSEEKVWALDEPATEMPIDELAWHFDIPFWNERGGTYNLKPIDVIRHPNEHAEEYQRTMTANMEYPIDIMEQHGRWLILDGLHRLTRAAIQGATHVHVRLIPRSRIPEIIS